MKCTIESVKHIELTDNTTIAVVQGFVPVNTDLIPDHIIKWIYYYTGVKAVVCDNGIKLTANAQTVCSETDVYSDVMGRRIAESKAKNKIYTFLRTFSDFMYQYFQEGADFYEDAAIKYMKCVEHELEHIDRLSNDQARS